MSIEKDPPMIGANPQGGDDDWDNVVFDDTEAPSDAAFSGGTFKRRPSKMVKYGGAAVVALLVAGGAFFYMNMDSANNVQTPEMMAQQMSETSPMPTPDGTDPMFPPENNMGTPDVMNSGNIETVENIDVDTLVTSPDDDIIAAFEPAPAEDGMTPPPFPDDMSQDPFADLDSNGMDTMPDPNTDMSDMPADVMADGGIQTTGDANGIEDMGAGDGDGMTDTTFAGDLAQPATTGENLNTGDMPELTTADGTEITGLTQEELDAQLEQQLIDSLMDSTAPPAPPVDPDAAAEGTDDGTGTAVPTAPGADTTTAASGQFQAQGLSREEYLRRIEAQALVSPTPERFYVVRQESAPVEQNRMLMNAKRALREGRYSKALNLFDELYESYPNDMAVILGRGVAYQQLGRYNEALSVYEVALRENPENLEALTNMLGILAMQDPAYSVDKLERLNARYPGNTGIKVQLALGYGDMGRLNEAVNLLMTAHNMEPSNPTIERGGLVQTRPDIGRPWRYARYHSCPGDSKPSQLNPLTFV